MSVQPSSTLVAADSATTDTSTNSTQASFSSPPAGLASLAFSQSTLSSSDSSTSSAIPKTASAPKEVRDEKEDSAAKAPSCQKDFLDTLETKENYYKLWQMSLKFLDVTKANIEKALGGKEQFFDFLEKAWPKFSKKDGYRAKAGILFGIEAWNAVIGLGKAATRDIKDPARAKAYYTSCLHIYRKLLYHCLSELATRAEVGGIGSTTDMAEPQVKSLIKFYASPTIFCLLGSSNTDIQAWTTEFDANIKKMLQNKNVEIDFGMHFSKTINYRDFYDLFAGVNHYAGSIATSPE